MFGEQYMGVYGNQESGLKSARHRNCCKAENNGWGKEGQLRSGFRADQLKRDGDLRQSPTMLRRHYRSEDSHRGPFKASGRNLARSDLKCNLRDGTRHLRWTRQTCSRHCRAPHATSVSDPHRTLAATFRHTVDTRCNVNRCRGALANALLGFKGPEVQLIAG